jgi:hypothetical protein
MSGQRLRARHIAGADGSQEFLGWFDNQRNEVCYFRQASDGALRCMPDGLFQGGFKDAGCTQPLAYRPKGGCVPAPAPKYGMIAGPSDPVTCSSGVSLRLVTGQIGAQSVYTGTPASCQELTAAQWMPMFDAFDLGPEVPPTEFVAGNYVVE